MKREMIDQIHSDPGLRIIAHRNALLVGWWHAPTEEQVRIMLRALRSVSRAYPRKHLLWNAIISGSPIFSEPVRKQLSAATMDPTLQGLATGHVILLGGFPGAATRAFLGAVTLASKSKTPTRVFGDVKTAAQWFAQCGRATEVSPSEADFERLHGELVSRAL